MYENFLDRTAEDDARDAKERLRQFLSATGAASMRVGSLSLPIYSPPTSRLDVREKMNRLVARALAETKSHVKIRNHEQGERVARKLAIKKLKGSQCPSTEVTTPQTAPTAAA